MGFRKEFLEDLLIIELPENLVANNIKEFKKVVEPHLGTNPMIVLDFSQVGIVDSLGIGTILSILKQVKAQKGDLKLYNVDEDLVDLFRLMRLDRVFDIYDTRQEAIDASL